jgi:hypothetical protein
MISSPISLVVLSLRSVHQKALRRVNDRFQLPRRNRPLLARPQQAAQHFVPVKLLPAPIFLHHHIGNFVNALVSRKTSLALLALPPAADRLRLLALAAVHHAILRKPTKRTFHR